MRRKEGKGGRTGSSGLTLVEVLIGMTILAVGLLATASMFSTGYTNVSAGGRTSMALTAARQMLEDVRSLPFGNIDDLNGFNTNNVASVPPVDATRDPGRTMAINIARKWRYALAGDGTGWNFTTAERAMWTVFSTGGAIFGGSGQISVVSQGATLRLVTVTVPVPRQGINVQLATLISN